jgi:hypothetical protein
VNTIADTVTPCSTPESLEVEERMPISWSFSSKSFSCYAGHVSGHYFIARLKLAFGYNDL